MSDQSHGLIQKRCHNYYIKKILLIIFKDRNLFSIFKKDIN